MRALIWFRSDLRLGDNPALAAATREASRGVVGVFAVCPSQWHRHDWADVRVDFVLRNIAALSSELERLNIPLLLLQTPLFRGLPRALLELADRHSCDALFFNRELEVDEIARDAHVRGAFEGSGRRVREFDAVCILAPGSVRTKEGGPYTVFTPFRKRFGELLAERDDLELAPRPKRQAEMPCEPERIPEAVQGFQGLRLPDLWPAGEREARRRLRRFLGDGIERYRERRDAPAGGGTSTLSPYLTTGVISARECLLGAIEANRGKLPVEPRGATGPSAWINELVWREFYKHLIIAFPRLCMGTNFRREYDAVPWSEREDHFEAWREGRTGVPIVDAAMRQLAREGWMHNRSRMIVAAFLTKNLLIDWRRGERHFMRHLIDGDLASNNGGWQWSASTGTDAAPYFRVFNPFSQSRKHDPEGEYIRRFVPELAGLEGDAVHEPSSLPPLARNAIGYSDPIVDVGASRTRAIEVFGAVKARS